MLKTLIRILSPLRSRIWDMVVFLFSVFWLQKEWMQSSLGERRGRDQKADAYSKSILSRRLFSLFNEQKNKGGLTLGFAKQYQNKPRPSALFSLSSLNTIAFIPSGANKQKIKRIDHSKCNVRASKNAGQAFSTQRYLYICYGLFFLFSSVLS